jgi:hypothetical protein
LSASHPLPSPRTDSRHADALTEGTHAHVRRPSRARSPSVGRPSAGTRRTRLALNTAFTTVNRDGYGSLNYIIGRMGEGKSDSWTLNFEKGTNYRIVGVCDKDCSDLDIEVLDGTDVLTKDVLEDDAPIVTFSPKTSGQLRVKVSMAKCSDEPCFFGFGIFQK